MNSLLVRRWWTDGGDQAGTIDFAICNVALAFLSTVSHLHHAGWLIYTGQTRTRGERGKRQRKTQRHRHAHSSHTRLLDGQIKPLEQNRTWHVQVILVRRPVVVMYCDWGQSHQQSFSSTHFIMTFWHSLLVSMLCYRIAEPCTTHCFIDLLGDGRRVNLSTVLWQDLPAHSTWWIR